MFLKGRYKNSRQINVYIHVLNSNSSAFVCLKTTKSKELLHIKLHNDGTPSIRINLFLLRFQRIKQMCNVNDVT